MVKDFGDINVKDIGAATTGNDLLDLMDGQDSDD